MKLFAFAGARRVASTNRTLLGIAAAIAEHHGATVDVAELRDFDIPLYDGDLEAASGIPAGVRQLAERIAAADGFLLASPEYNFSVPGVLKNAIDVGSRPYGQSVWGGKPGAVISVSPGAIGGFGANHHLRQSLVFLDVPAMQQPEAYIGGAAKLFAPDGTLVNGETREFLKKFMEAFGAWVELNSTKPGKAVS